jgi:hypothetical protein
MMIVADLVTAQHTHVYVHVCHYMYVYFVYVKTTHTSLLQLLSTARYLISDLT